MEQVTLFHLPKPKMVATDVDGTLIDHREQVSARTRAAVAALIADGVPFVLATGRPPRWIDPVVDGLGYAPLCVCGNGAVIYDSAQDRILSTRVLDVDTLEWLAELAERLLPGCGLAAERVGVSAHDAATPQFVSSPEYEHAWLNPDDTRVARSEVIAAPAIKMLIRLAGATSAFMREVLEPHLVGRADLTYSTDDGLVELSAPGVTKATGLATVAQRLGVQHATLIAFGDMPNDVPMLRLAGHGVAMANAHQEAKEAANEVAATNNEDGVARVLERWWA
ncbi:sugar phosphate phosphatase [Nocardia otitidiscaviarum]|uniref:Cof-type HAD-IIB family hydrolase n=1 Tax=Nocardia otitidiscaviarum TaxID=1823 RepID=A0A378YCH7_9NOCA|nr:Cof-type HAD-IIB family hydrolase [Nocardia otitidiscaviarum]MBF6178851.1 Cof-type HAD-IIB family hydrolase [Nocardia otitidiscaviarum]MCP9621861.1 Cof-type HAD-IIB family hydrolase [Nocardia otitidiscaviarum]QDP82483.1 Cof-type HAD-IIB family hydrolase [Nocardia otitidiscaviarum]SUA74935.1 sugar phosphate phosphatase [Nocardia otitidiscaviarum]